MTIPNQNGCLFMSVVVAREICSGIRMVSSRVYDKGKGILKNFGVGMEFRDQILCWNVGHCELSKLGLSVFYLREVFLALCEQVFCCCVDFQLFCVL